MASRTFTVASFTTEARADASSMVNSKYMALQGGSATQITKILGVSYSGLDAATVSPQVLLLALDGTVATSTTALTTGESDTADSPATADLTNPVKAFTAVSGTAPQRAKKYLAHLGFNALGGLAHKYFPFGYEPMIIGASANSGEVSFSGFTGTTPALIGATIKYETL